MNDSMNSFSFPLPLPSGKSGNTESLFSSAFAAGKLAHMDLLLCRESVEIEREKSAAQMKTTTKFNIFLSNDVEEGKRRKKSPWPDRL